MAQPNNTQCMEMSKPHAMPKLHLKHTFIIRSGFHSYPPNLKLPDHYEGHDENPIEHITCL